MATTTRAGRLTITFPANLGQLPDFYNADPSRTHKYVDNDGKPLFPFGYGLSYTNFRYDNLAVTAPAAGSKGRLYCHRQSYKYRNPGQGQEVAQLYLREDVSSVETPDRALQAFTRVSLKPGESQVVQFPRGDSSRSRCGSVDRRWVVEPGKYTAWAGGSSEAALEAHVTLAP